MAYDLLFSSLSHYSDTHLATQIFTAVNFLVCILKGPAPAICL